MLKRNIYIVITLAMFILSTSVVSASGFGWGYTKNEEHKAPEIGKYKEILEKYGAYYIDPAEEKTVYITFDNGYEEGYTEEILAILKEESVPATFFVTGHYVESEPDLVKRMVDEGHIIGNHSYHHPDFTVMTKENIKRELETLEEAVASITDQKEIKYVRPPRGTFNKETLQWANELNYIHVFWSLAFNDWNTDKQKGWEYAYEEIMKQIHPGAIILLHAVSSDNAAALEQVIGDLKQQGYQFKSLDDLVFKDLIKQYEINQ